MTKIITDACQNHNGSRERLGEMVRQAAMGGADFVKMQTIYSDDLARRERFEEGRFDEQGKQIVMKRPYDAEFNRLSKLDLTLDDHRFFIEKCNEYGVIPLTTVFARHRIKEIGQLPWPGKWVKVASYDCASIPMLRELAEYFDNFIISTGATYNEEIEKTAALMGELGKNFVFLHCVTSYPNTLDMANLSRMDWLRQFVPQVGWSDHTLIERDGIIAAKVAMMLGADYVERHFTVLNAEETKDGPVSIAPDLLRELNNFRNLSKEEQRIVVEKECPNWHILLGEKDRKMTDTELLNRDYYRGRFASPVGDGWVYNWEEKPIY